MPLKCHRVARNWRWSQSLLGPAAGILCGLTAICGTDCWAACGIMVIFKNWPKLVTRCHEQEKTLSICVHTWEGSAASHRTRCYEVSLGESGLPRAVRAGVTSKTSGFFRDQRGHLNSHYWGSNQEEEREVKSDVLGAEKWREKQGPASHAGRTQVCLSPLKSEPRAHSGKQSSLPASGVASLVTNRIRGT